MDTSFFIRGLLIGFSIAATVGPMSVLCIQRTLNKGQLYGLVSGLGIATADGVYGSIAAFGLTLITNFLIKEQIWIRLIGGIFLIYLGIKTIFSKPPERAATLTMRFKWLSWSICLYILADTYEPTYNSLLCSHLRRNRSRERKQKLPICSLSRDWSILWFGVVVDYLDKHNQLVTKKNGCTMAPLD